MFVSNWVLSSRCVPACPDSPVHVSAGCLSSWALYCWLSGRSCTCLATESRSLWMRSVMCTWFVGRWSSRRPTAWSSGELCCIHVASEWLEKWLSDWGSSHEQLPRSEKWLGNSEIIFEHKLLTWLYTDVTFTGFFDFFFWLFHCFTDFHKWLTKHFKQKC